MVRGMEAGPFALAPAVQPSEDQAAFPSFDLSLGEPQRQNFPLDLACRALATPQIHHYYPVFGAPGLREQIHAHFYANVRADCDVLVTHGAIQGVDLLLRTYVRPGDEVLVPDPGFPPYVQLAHFAGAKVTPYPLKKNADGFVFDVAAIASRVTERSRVLIVNSPHNPTGAILPQASHQALVKLLDVHPRLLIVSDEVYGKVLLGSEQSSSLAGLHERLFVVNSLSKSHALQGLRVGWILLSPGATCDVAPLLQNAVGCVSSVSQEIARSILQDAPAQLVDYRQAFDLVAGVLAREEVPFLRPHGTFFLLAAVRDDLAAAHALAAGGVKVVAGRAFGQGGVGYVRLCFAQSNEMLKRAFGRFSAIYHDEQLGLLCH